MGLTAAAVVAVAIAGAERLYGRGRFTMAHRKRKLWGAPASTPVDLQQTAAEGAPKESSAVDTVVNYLDYSGAANREGSGTDAEVASGQAAAVGDDDESLDLSGVGKEVGAVLQSAHEAAARIRRTADEEAERVRRDARAAAAEKADEAGRAAEADRAEARRIRAEADSYAEETRTAADAFAEKRLTEAEREAAHALDQAQRRLAASDAEVEEKLRQASVRSRHRVEALEAEAARAEDRVENILAIFRGMTSELEELLERQSESRSKTQTPEQQETFEDVLRPREATVGE